jgi:hypothetical protein
MMTSGEEEESCCDSVNRTLVNSTLSDVKEVGSYARVFVFIV